MSKDHVMTEEEARLHLMNAELERDRREAELAKITDIDDGGGFDEVESPKFMFNLWNNVVKAYDRLLNHLMKLPESPEVVETVGIIDGEMRKARTKANSLAYQARKAKAPPNQ